MNNESSIASSSSRGKGQGMVLVMMPFLGASWKEWASVIKCFNSKYCCIGVDMPGFGDAAEVRDYTVSQMAAYLADFLAELQIGPFVLVGHSMSGKVAMIAARLNATNPKKFQGLQGLVLVASSPPQPEPMEDDKREQMLKDLGTPGRVVRHHAEKFIRDNIFAKVASATVAELVDEVLRMNPAAWTAWLQEGSKEDWSERVGTLNLPTLVVAGADDKDLGPKTQFELVLPHFRAAQLEVLKDCSHLIPVERPRELAELIMKFVVDIEGGSGTTPDSSDIGLTCTEYEKLVASERVSEPTREVLVDRGTEGSPKNRSSLFSELEVDCLKAVVMRVLPGGSVTFDPTARLLDQIDRGKGKGWRYAELPAALDMHKRALATLDNVALSACGVSFVALISEQQDELLADVQRGKVNSLGGKADVGVDLDLTSSQMKRWFEELRSELTSIYVSHPDTLARIGYSGIGDGADSKNMTGFVQLGLSKVEDWEPMPSGLKQL